MATYSYAHRKLREQWRPLVEAGEVRCWRCQRWLHPLMPWDLGHDDHDKTVWRGPECRKCNRGTAAVRGNKSRRRKRNVYEF